MYWITVVFYTMFLLCIAFGGGYLIKILFYSSTNQLACVGLDNEAYLTFARMTSVIFWVIFIPLCILPYFYPIKLDFDITNILKNRFKK